MACVPAQTVKDGSGMLPAAPTPATELQNHTDMTINAKIMIHCANRSRPCNRVELGIDSCRDPSPAAPGTALRSLGAWDTWPGTAVAPAETAGGLVGGCTDDACGSYNSAGGLDTEPSVYDMGTAPIGGDSDPHQSSCFSRHAGWGMAQDVAAPSTAVSALMSPRAPPLPVAPLGRSAAQCVAEDEAAEPSGPLYAACGDLFFVGGEVDEEEEEGMEEVDGGEVDEDEIHTLLRPGGSPCLPLEVDYVIAGAAGAAMAQRPQTVRGVTTSVGLDGVNRCTTGSGVSGAAAGNGTSMASCRRRCAPPLPPPSTGRHRACQFGYTDSAPAHGTIAATAAAAAAVGHARMNEVALAFLRTPGGGAWPQCLGGNLSAPPAAVTTAAAAAAKHADACALPSAPAAAAVLELPSGRESTGGFEAKHPGHGEHGSAVPASAAPPPRPYIGSRRKWTPASASPVSRWTSAFAASALTSASERGSNLRRNAAARSSSIYSGASDAAPSAAGFIETPLADGLAALLQELGKAPSGYTGAGADAGSATAHVDSGKLGGGSGAAVTVSPTKPSAARRFARGFFSCFSGH